LTAWYPMLFVHSHPRLPDGDVRLVLIVVVGHCVQRNQPRPTVRLLDAWLLSPAGLLVTSARWRSSDNAHPGFVTLADHLSSRRSPGPVFPQCAHSSPVYPFDLLSIHFTSSPSFLPASVISAASQACPRCQNMGGCNLRWALMPVMAKVWVAVVWAILTAEICVHIFTNHHWSCWAYTVDYYWHLLLVLNN